MLALLLVATACAGWKASQVILSEEVREGYRDTAHAGTAIIVAITVSFVWRKTWAYYRAKEIEKSIRLLKSTSH
jgi:putative flippase GtrA